MSDRSVSLGVFRLVLPVTASFSPVLASLAVPLRSSRRRVVGRVLCVFEVARPAVPPRVRGRRFAVVAASHL